jgi:hypothetical protein
LTQYFSDSNNVATANYSGPTPYNFSLNVKFPEKNKNTGNTIVYSDTKVDMLADIISFFTQNKFAERMNRTGLRLNNENTPVFLDKNNKTNPQFKSYKKVLDGLSSRFGIKYTIINNPNANWAGRYLPNGTIEINEAFIEEYPDAPFHEFFHPFLDVIARDNKALFNNLKSAFAPTVDSIFPVLLLFSFGQIFNFLKNSITCLEEVHSILQVGLLVNKSILLENSI